ncbi:MAG: TonB-dependent receptor [Bacteroidota bacterium]
MKNQTAIFISLMSFWVSLAQTTINGTVTDKSGNAISGANVFLEGTYDGASTTDEGTFFFETLETGTQTLVISALAYETHYEMGEVGYLKNLNIVMIEAINQLNGVTLTAGTFEAGDNSKVSVLKPLDIVTTAGALADVVGALQTLPGTTTVNEDGRLFVRGGGAEETQVFIDGIRVFQPFFGTAQDIPTRSRFSPMLFKGITFSTGGYSAEYGQALSSVLLMNTTDVPDQEKTEVGALSVGAQLAHTEIWGGESLSLNTQYINLAPYETLIPSTQGMQWNRPFESFGGEAVFRSKGERSIFKLYTGFNHSNLDIDQEDINFDDFVRFRLKNNNLYFNSSYKFYLENDWIINTGASISWDTNDISFMENDIDNNETAGHVKVKVKKLFTNRYSLNVGAELFNVDYEETFAAPDGFTFESAFDDVLWAGFVEGDIFFSNDFALKLGGRLENSSVLDEFTFSPRLSLAYKSGAFSQFSMAYGDFYQNPIRDVLKFDQNLTSEKTSHYILNYQYLNNGKTFRAEAYYKDYDDLVKFDTEFPQLGSEYNNSGSGYATGLDIFWRDNKSFKNLDYWVSYSYLDTERNYRNFLDTATPNFAPRHNFSVVTKYWADKLRSQIGLTYQFGSGRPYDNPNTPEFMAERTKPLNNLSVNWAYLIDQQKILFFSVGNVLGINNINNYQYANTPNTSGLFERRAVRPAADSFFFVGFFWTISNDKKSNQLNNL